MKIQPPAIDRLQRRRDQLGTLRREEIARPVSTNVKDIVFLSR